MKLAREGGGVKRPLALTLMHEGDITRLGVLGIATVMPCMCLHSYLHTLAAKLCSPCKYNCSRWGGEIRRCPTEVATPKPDDPLSGHCDLQT